jgi:DNA-binding FadR family transcriptional regulator
MLDRSLADHKRIYEAIRHRNRNLAVKEMTRHMANIRKAMENFYHITHPATSESAARAEHSAHR